MICWLTRRHLLAFNLFIFVYLETRTLSLGQSFGQSIARSNRVLQKSAFCDLNFIHFTLTFERPFLGLIYSDSAYGIDRCTYVNGSVFSTTFYNLSIPLNDCRSQAFANGTRQNVLTVQRDPRILEASDNQYMVMCVPNSGGSAGVTGFGGLGSGDLAIGQDASFTVTFASIAVQATLGSTEVVTNAASGATRSADYTVEVQAGEGPNGQRVEKVLNIGEPISYVVKVKPIADHDTRIGRCWATDDQTSIQLSDDQGCSLQRGGNVWNNFQSNTLPDGTRIYYTNIKAWAFPSSTKVNIFCNLHLKRGSPWPASNCASTTGNLPPTNLQSTAAKLSKQTASQNLRQLQEFSRSRSSNGFDSPLGTNLNANSNSFFDNAEVRIQRQSRDASASATAAKVAERSTGVDDPVRNEVSHSDSESELDAHDFSTDSTDTIDSSNQHIIAVQGGFQVHQSFYRSIDDADRSATTATSSSDEHQKPNTHSNLLDALRSSNSLSSEDLLLSAANASTRALLAGDESICIPKQYFVIATVISGILLLLAFGVIVGLALFTCHQRRANSANLSLRESPPIYRSTFPSAIFQQGRTNSADHWDSLMRQTKTGHYHRSNQLAGKTNSLSSSLSGGGENNAGTIERLTNHSLIRPNRR